MLLDGPPRPSPRTRTATHEQPPRGNDVPLDCPLADTRSLPRGHGVPLDCPLAGTSSPPRGHDCPRHEQSSPRTRLPPTRAVLPAATTAPDTSSPPRGHDCPRHGQSSPRPRLPPTRAVAATRGGRERRRACLAPPLPRGGLRIELFPDCLRTACGPSPSNPAARTGAMWTTTSCRSRAGTSSGRWWRRGRSCTRAPYRVQAPWVQA